MQQANEIKDLCHLKVNGRLFKFRYRGKNMQNMMKVLIRSYFSLIVEQKKDF